MGVRDVYLGTDGGATTSKVGAVWADGRTVSTRLLQRPTSAEAGPDAVVAGWAASIADYLQANDLGWDDVRGVGLAIPGPYERYGVLGHSPNLPATFEGFDVHAGYERALRERAGRAIPLIETRQWDFTWWVSTMSGSWRAISRRRVRSSRAS